MSIFVLLWFGNVLLYGVILKRDLKGGNKGEERRMKGRRVMGGGGRKRGYGKGRAGWEEALGLGETPREVRIVR